MQTLPLLRSAAPDMSAFTNGTSRIEGLLVLDEYERPFVASVSERRLPYDWGMDRAGQAFHIEPVGERIPADLDPDLAPATVRPLIRLDDGRETRLGYLRSMMVATVAVAFFAAIGGITLYAAAIRLPAVQQASIDAEGV